MRIKKIRLKNGYKRFHDLTIDLGDRPARIVALVGLNGSGKSSVLDGLLYHVSAYGAFGSGGRRDHTYHSMKGEPNVTYENIEIEFVEGNYLAVRTEKEKLGKANTIFSFRSPYRYNSDLKITQTKSISDIRLNGYGAGDSSSLDQKMEENYRRLHAKFLNFIEQADVPMSVARAKIIGDLNSSISKCLGLEISSIGNVEGNKGTLYFKKQDHPQEFEYNVLSSGEKEVVDILLDLYLRQDDYNDTIFLIDEPELHINTSIQKNLLIEINRLIGENCQIWVTTHSIGFLRALQTEMKGECQIIHFKPEYELASKAKVLTPANPNPTMWREIFSIALDDLTNLISPKTLIYCEGRAVSGSLKEKGLDAQVFNNIFGSGKPETLFVSSGGNTELDQRSGVAISILGKVFPSVEILVLKDRDMASGASTNEADRQTYLKTNPAFHRVLNRWELENYLFDKEVLQAYCSAENLSFDVAAYDKFVTDVTNQNLKDNSNHFKNFCGIKSSINPDSFKILLSQYVAPSMTVYKELEDCIFKRL